MDPSRLEAIATALWGRPVAEQSPNIMTARSRARPAPVMPQAPEWVHRQAPRRGPGGPFVPLPRESRLAPVLAMREQVRAENALPPRPPPIVYGPGAVTGESDPQAVPFASVALRPSFADSQQTPLPSILRAHEQMPALPQEPRHGLEPPTDPEATHDADLDAIWEAALTRARLKRPKRTG